MCSVTWVMMWLPRSLYISAMPLMARLLRLGGAGGEDDLLGGGADELGDLLAGLLDGLLGLPAEGVVAAGGVAELGAEVGHHGFEDARVHRRGGVVVHVDGQVDALGQAAWRTR